MIKKIKSSLFEIEDLNVPNENENIVIGGRDKMSLAIKVLEKSGIKKIGVIGWGSQGPAQSQNLRDSLEKSNIEVKIGLRKGSSSWKDAENSGMKVGEMYNVLSESDLNILLISDDAQANNYEKIFETLKDGSTLGLSHGFLLGHLKSEKKYFPENINIIGVCPKGMGPSVRKLYEQGKTINGAGINSSFAVEQDIDGNATDIAIAWAILIGSPYIFKTTLTDEFKSDIFGERGILLGGVHGIVEALYQKKIEKGESDKVAYKNSVVNITGPLSKKISKEGIKSILLKFQDNDVFNKNLAASYKESYPLLEEIYDEVASGNEIRGVILAGSRKQIFVPEQIDKTPMWRVGEGVRMSSDTNDDELDLETSGIYIGTMMAQIDVLKKNGHSWSEIVNESVIEAVDSLNPFMHARGVDYMVDNCSRTARLGSRKWGPRFRACIEVALYDEKYTELDIELLEKIRSNDVHVAIDSCGKLRPSIDIFVQ